MQTFANQSGFSFQLTLIFTLLISSGCAKSQDNPPLPPLPQSVKEAAILAGTESCQKFIKRLQSDLSNVDHSFYDFISVPETPNDPSSPMVKVFYYGRAVPG